MDHVVVGLVALDDGVLRTFLGVHVAVCILEELVLAVDDGVGVGLVGIVYMEKEYD